MLDEYGYGPRDGWHFKINITACLRLWRKIRGPRKSDIDQRLAEARKRQAEYEAWFSNPTHHKGE